MANKKRIATTLGAMALTAVIAVGGTLAYLSTITETKRNEFTSSKNIDGTIEEKEWDKTHEKGWTDYQPGEATAKDPKIVLTKGSAWAAMRLDYLDAADNKLNYVKFSKYAAHDGINDGWKIIARNGEGSDLYMYETVVTEDAPSATLFDSITVSAGITTVHSSSVTEYFKRVIEKDANGVITKDETVSVGKDEVQGTDAYFDQDGNPVGVGSKLPKFAIEAKGYAVQSEGINEIKAAEELINLANTGIDESSNAYFRTVAR